MGTVADIKSETITTTKTTYQITGKQLIELFNRLAFAIPENAEVIFRTGGGQVCNIDKNTPIIIKYTETK